MDDKKIIKKLTVKIFTTIIEKVLLDCEHRRVCVVCVGPMAPPVLDSKRDALILELQRLINSAPLNLKVWFPRDYWEKASTKRFESDKILLEKAIKEAKECPKDYCEQSLGRKIGE